MDGLIIFHSRAIDSRVKIENDFISSQLSNTTTSDREEQLTDILAVCILHECKPFNKKKKKKKKKERRRRKRKIVYCGEFGYQGPAELGACMGKRAISFPSAPTRCDSIYKRQPIATDYNH